jgi:hypothetical protein
VAKRKSLSLKQQEYQKSAEKQLGMGLGFPAQPRQESIDLPKKHLPLCSQRAI